MGRMQHIDAMRGFAAIAVIYCHVAEYAMNLNLVSSKSERFIFSVLTEDMDLGKIGVTMFFAISGFVIPFSIFRYKHRPLVSFAISRFFRLYPAYWLSIPLGLLLLFVLKNREITAGMILANIAMIQEFIGQQDIMGVYWTLQIELVFYVVCAILFAMQRLDDVEAVTGSAMLFLLGAFGLSVMRFALDKKYPVALPLGLSVMFWGLIVRHAYSDGAKWRMALGYLSSAIVVMVPIISILAYNRDMGFHETWYKYTITYYIGLGLFYIFCSRIRRTHAILAYLGTISYSIYLLGFAVQEAIVRIFGDQIFTVVPTHVVIVATVLITIGLAAAVYRWIEAPSVQLGRHIIAMLGNTDARVPQSL